MSQNGSQFILGRYPTGAFTNLDMADAQITSMCTFFPHGQLAGVVTGGNFTSLGGQQSTAAALFNPTNGQISPLSGLTGQVRALYCDNATSTVFVGGMFTALNSSNAIAWTTGWTNLPISGFNGPVNAIERMPNGHMVFGGQFTGIGQIATPRVSDAQVVNVGSASISSGPNATNVNYRDPRNIICKTSAQGGPGNAWVTADNGGGYWRADFGFGFNPSKLRLYQSTVPNYGTRTFRFTAFPINGIMNLTYTDPATGEERSCTNVCPMPENNSTAQDFRFVNDVGMDSFIIDVTSIYGDGGGFDGIELFQNDIYSYAINDFNEPQCDDVSPQGSSSITSGNWTSVPAGSSASAYLSASMPDGTTNGTQNLSVVFYPDIRQAGNYSVTVYTPGCIGDNTCNSRGRVNITGLMASSPTRQTLTPTAVFQTNDYEKYDTVYQGYVDQSSGSFRPSVTLTPALSQSSVNGNGLTVVAQRVRFELLSSTGGLNGLYDFDPNSNTLSADYSSNAVDFAGTQMNEDAIVTSLKQMGDATFVGGRFGGQHAALNNIYLIENGNTSALSNGGLNDAVNTMYGDATTLYVGGNFSSTFDNATRGLGNVAAYNPSQRVWSALGAGVNGEVTTIVPLGINFTGSSTPTPCIAVSGIFSEVNAFGQNQSAPVDNLAVWVPSRGNWLVNLPGANLALSGTLSTYAVVPGQDNVYAGNLDSATLSASGSAGLQSGNSGLSLDQVPIRITPSQGTSSASVSAKRKRDAPQGSVSGVYTGLYYSQNNVMAQIFGGHFQASITNGSTASNLAVVYLSDGNTTSGLTMNQSDSSVITTLDTHDTTLFAGGNIPTGMIMFNLTSRDLSTPQAPSVTGGSVYSIAVRPSANDVYVGGSFTSAGLLQCLGLCVWDTQLMQWRTVRGAAVGASSVINSLQWTSNDRLVLAGNFTIDGMNATLASYDAKAESFSLMQGSNDTRNVPGPITTFSAVDSSYSSFFLAGVAKGNNSAYITRYTPGSGGASDSYVSILNSPTTLGSSSQVESLQVIPLNQAHGSSPLIGSSQALLVTGPLNLPTFGNVSAATWNGTSFEPFVLSTRADGGAGSIRRLFVQNPANLFSNNSHHLALGYIVLIGLAIALALVFLIILIGFVAERIRRRREGYVPAPSYNYGAEKTGGRSTTPLGVNIGDISPERLFGGVRTGSPARL